MTMLHWGLHHTRSGRISKRRGRSPEPSAPPPAQRSGTAPVAADSDDEDGGGLPFMLPRPPSNTLHTSHNNVYFSDDVTSESAFALNRELRNVADKVRAIALLHRCPIAPVRLHLTTNGGSIHAALTVVDCIRALQRDGVEVHTVVDGFVASAGTLISIHGSHRFMQANAYMLIHELRSGFWGKMSDIRQELVNLDKMTHHLVGMYVERTKMSRKTLEKLLSKDAVWNAEESMKRGLVDEVL